MVPWLAGRLAASLGGAGTSLPLVLGPPERWRDAQAAKSGGLGGRPSGMAAAAAGSQVAALQDRFR